MDKNSNIDDKTVGKTTETRTVLRSEIISLDDQSNGQNEGESHKKKKKNENNIEETGIKSAGHDITITTSTTRNISNTSNASNMSDTSDTATPKTTTVDMRTSKVTDEKRRENTTEEDREDMLEMIARELSGGDLPKIDQNVGPLRKEIENEEDSDKPRVVLDVRYPDVYPMVNKIVRFEDCAHRNYAEIIKMFILICAKSYEKHKNRVRKEHNDILVNGTDDFVGVSVNVTHYTNKDGTRKGFWLIVEGIPDLILRDTFGELSKFHDKKLGIFKRSMESLCALYLMSVEKDVENDLVSFGEKNEGIKINYVAENRTYTKEHDFTEVFSMENAAEKRCNGTNDKNFDDTKFEIHREALPFLLQYPLPFHGTRNFFAVQARMFASQFAKRMLIKLDYKHGQDMPVNIAHRSIKFGENIVYLTESNEFYEEQEIARKLAEAAEAEKNNRGAGEKKKGKATKGRNKKTKKADDDKNKNNKKKSGQRKAMTPEQKKQKELEEKQNKYSSLLGWNPLDDPRDIVQLKKCPIHLFTSIVKNQFEYLTQEMKYHQREATIAAEEFRDSMFISFFECDEVVAMMSMGYSGMVEKMRQMQRSKNTKLPHMKIALPTDDYRDPLDKFTTINDPNSEILSTWNQYFHRFFFSVHPFQDIVLLYILFVIGVAQYLDFISASPLFLVQGNPGTGKSTGFNLWQSLMDPCSYTEYTLPGSAKKNFALTNEQDYQNQIFFESTDIFEEDFKLLDHAGKERVKETKANITEKKGCHHYLQYNPKTGQREVVKITNRFHGAIIASTNNNVIKMDPALYNRSTGAYYMPVEKDLAKFIRQKDLTKLNDKMRQKCMDAENNFKEMTRFFNLIMAILGVYYQTDIDQKETRTNLASLVILRLSKPMEQCFKNPDIDNRFFLRVVDFAFIIACMRVFTMLFLMKGGTFFKKEFSMSLILEYCQEMAKRTIITVCDLVVSLAIFSYNILSQKATKTMDYLKKIFSYFPETSKDGKKSATSATETEEAVKKKKQLWKEKRKVGTDNGKERDKGKGKEKSKGKLTSDSGKVHFGAEDVRKKMEQLELIKKTEISDDEDEKMRDNKIREKGKEKENEKGKNTVGDDRESESEEGGDEEAMEVDEEGETEEKEKDKGEKDKEEEEGEERAEEENQDDGEDGSTLMKIPVKNNVNKKAFMNEQLRQLESFMAKVLVNTFDKMNKKKKVTYPDIKITFKTDLVERKIDLNYLVNDSFLSIQDFYKNLGETISLQAETARGYFDKAYRNGSIECAHKYEILPYETLLENAKGQRGGVAKKERGAKHEERLQTTTSNDGRYIDPMSKSHQFNDQEKKFNLNSLEKLISSRRMACRPPESVVPVIIPRKNQDQDKFEHVILRTVALLDSSIQNDIGSFLQEYLPYKGFRERKISYSAHVNGKSVIKTVTLKYDDKSEHHKKEFVIQGIKDWSEDTKNMFSDFFNKDNKPEELKRSSGMGGSRKTKDGRSYEYYVKEGVDLDDFMMEKHLDLLGIYNEQQREDIKNLPEIIVKDKDNYRATKFFNEIIPRASKPKSKSKSKSKSESKSDEQTRRPKKVDY